MPFAPSSVRSLFPRLSSKERISVLADHRGDAPAALALLRRWMVELNTCQLKVQENNRKGIATSWKEKQ